MRNLESDRNLTNEAIFTRITCETIWTERKTIMVENFGVFLLLFSFFRGNSAAFELPISVSNFITEIVVSPNPNSAALFVFRFFWTLYTIRKILGLNR